MKFRNRIALAAMLLLSLSGIEVRAAVAADLDAPPLPAEARDPMVVARDYISRRAVLLMIRATFDVIQNQEIPSLLAQDLRRIGASGPTEEDLAALDTDLLMEASYYIVTLRYLIEVGGGLWPSDRPESTYVNDAIVRLRTLTTELIDAVNDRADPLSIMRQVDEITAWTEGYAEPPPELDHFAGRDAIVDEALRKHGPRTST